MISNKICQKCKKCQLIIIRFSVLWLLRRSCHASSHRPPQAHVPAVGSQHNLPTPAEPVKCLIFRPFSVLGVYSEQSVTLRHTSRAFSIIYHLSVNILRLPLESKSKISIYILIINSFILPSICSPYNFLIDS